MKSENLRMVLGLAAIVVIFIGFRFVTQAGQGLGVVQNDGYAGSGGLMILGGGIILGWLIRGRKG